MWGKKDRNGVQSVGQSVGQKWGADTNTVPPQRGRQEESETEGGIRHQQAAVSQAGIYSACIVITAPSPDRMKMRDNPGMGKEASPTELDNGTED